MVLMLEVSGIQGMCACVCVQIGIEVQGCVC